MIEQNEQEIIFNYFFLNSYIKNFLTSTLSSHVLKATTAVSTQLEMRFHVLEQEKRGFLL